MKKKSIKSKINTFSKEVKSIKKKGAYEKGQKARSAFQAMESDLNITIDLQKEIRNLKGALKTKKKDLVLALKKLKSDRNAFKKAKSLVDKIDLTIQRTPRKKREVLPAPIVDNVLPQPKKRGRKPKISADKPSQTKVRAARKPVVVKEAAAEGQPKRGRGRARKVAEPVAKVETKAPAKRGRKKATEKPAAKPAVKKAPRAAAKTVKPAKLVKAAKPAKTAKPAKAAKTSKPAKAAKPAAPKKGAKPGRKPAVKKEKPAEVQSQVTENPAPAENQGTPETPVQ
ncbi:MAG TPA: hypothetical protein VK179_14745 [Bacteroidales bacterium]|nr:hypothetical protein [Bacteroidales bacterium]